MQKQKLLLYGANGYTAGLIIEEALSKGIRPVLAGRSANALKPLADRFGLDYRVFVLDSLPAIKEKLSDIAVVLHAAGPFIFTYQNMLQACLETGTHYLDITGEYQVFEGCKLKDAAAKQAGIMVLPGVGFDVVPSDCLAAGLKEKMQDATHLKLSFASVKSGFSRGTAKTMVEGLHEGGMIRKDGKLTKVPAAFKVATIDYGAFKIVAATIPWGDISTAYTSTGIPDIEVYMGATPALVTQMKRSNYLHWLFKMRWVKNILKGQIDKRKPGPDEKQRTQGKTFFWGEVTNSKNESIVARMQTPEGYKLTAITAVLIAGKVLNGNFKPGYQTPATAYGSGLILEVPGCNIKFGDY
jgi:short subunit dehydrogenase-like uncharacterized protein